MFKLTWRILPIRPASAAGGGVVRGTGRAQARAAAEYLAARARIHCPVDTGKLRAGIDVEGSMAGAIWHVLVRVPYGPAVEFGSMHRGTFIPPNPFLRRARADALALYPDLIATAYVRALPGEYLGITIRAAA